MNFNQYAESLIDRQIQFEDLRHDEKCRLTGYFILTLPVMLQGEFIPEVDFDQHALGSLFAKVMMSNDVNKMVELVKYIRTTTTEYFAKQLKDIYDERYEKSWES